MAGHCLAAQRDGVPEMSGVRNMPEEAHWQSGRPSALQPLSSSFPLQLKRTVLKFLLIFTFTRSRSNSVSVGAQYGTESSESPSLGPTSTKRTHRGVLDAGRPNPCLPSTRQIQRLNGLVRGSRINSHEDRAQRGSPPQPDPAISVAVKESELHIADDRTDS